MTTRANPSDSDSDSDESSLRAEAAIFEASVSGQPRIVIWVS